MMSEIMADNSFCSYKVAIFCVMEIIQKKLLQNSAKLILLAKFNSVWCTNKDTLII